MVNYTLPSGRTRGDPDTATRARRVRIRPCRANCRAWAYSATRSAKRTGRSPSAVAQDAAEAKTLGDETLQRIAGTSLDTPSEIAALAAMDEQERQQFIVHGARP